MDFKNRLLKHRYVDPNGCWNCMASTYSNGYGRVTINYKTYLAHRLAAHVWLDFDLNSQLLVCHKCDNRRCFNPEHLYIGTKVDNAVDMVNKGRDKNQNVDKIKCDYGHEFSEENTGIYNNGDRYCKKCKIIRGRLRSRIWSKVSNLGKDL